MFSPFRGGTFDDWYSGPGGDLWVEYKFIVLPKRSSTVIVPGLSELQRAWGRARFEEGRTVRVIVGCKEGGVFFSNPDDWEAGCTLEEFLALMNSRKDLASIINRYTE